MSPHKYDRPRRPRRRPRYAANDNDPVKAEYLRLADAQERLRGLVNVTLKFAIFLAVDQCFFVVSPRFQKEVKASRKTVHNHLKELERHGFIMKLEKRRGTFPRYMLTSIDAWRQLAGDDGAEIAPKCEAVTHPVCNRYAAKTLSEPNDLKAPLHRTAPHRRDEDHSDPVPFRPSARLEPLRPQEGAHLPAWLRTRFLNRFGLGAARSWLFGASWIEADQALEVGNTAYYWFARDARAFCRENELSVRMRNAEAS